MEEDWVVLCQALHQAIGASEWRERVRKVECGLDAQWCEKLAEQLQARAKLVFGKGGW